MNCEDLLGLLHDYHGDELVIEVRQQFEVHFRGCANCDVLVHSYTHTVRIARVLPRCGLPPAFEARLRAVLEPELKGDSPTS